MSVRVESFFNFFLIGGCNSAENIRVYTRKCVHKYLLCNISDLNSSILKCRGTQDKEQSRVGFYLLGANGSTQMVASTQVKLKINLLKAPHVS